MKQSHLLIFCYLLIVTPSVLCEETNWLSGFKPFGTANSNKPKSEQEKDKEQSEANQKKLENQLTPASNQDENAQKLFTDATYDKFAEQKEKPIFPEEYLEPQA